VAKARNHQSVDWGLYFNKIKQQCPWSYAAWQRGQILVRNLGQPQALGDYQAIVYVSSLNRRRLKKLCAKLNTSKEYEWLWSHPGYGSYATDVPCLIQQNRQVLDEIRAKICNTHK
jgi:hypothetical protein